ncbi:Nup85 nucleoporin-domain-containing protein [Amylocystis lapponica]|nr:Nup85 nucleoporin-domain-containing protein [Amylocystis lapponica]
MGGSANLVPPLFEQGALDDFKQSGRTLLASISPRDDSLAIYAASNTPPSSLLPPELLKAAREKGVEILDSEDGLKAVSKLAIDYVNFCKECCFYASQDNVTRTEPLQYDAEHYRKLYTCFSLFSVLYLSDSGLEDVPVGDELMEWLNTHFIEPSTEEGDQLSKLDRPWEDETFGPTLQGETTLRGLSKASAFFLDVLSNHPSTNLPQLSKHLIPLLTHHPRLHQFVTEREFAIASRRWRDKVKALRIELDRVPEDDRQDDFENWWQSFSDIVAVLEGRADVLKRSARISVQIGRKYVPPGASSSTQAPQERLAVSQALSEAARLDKWLAAHFADFMEPLELIDKEPDDSDLSPRSQYVLDYAQYLHSDPALWRIAVDYMCSCGDVGKEMADQVLMRVPLGLRRGADETAAEEESERIRAGALPDVFKEISETCREYQREEIRRMICRVAAQTFMQEKNYGLAVSYCASAEDWPGLGRIVDRILDEYVVQGPEKYARLVANIAPSLQALRKGGGAYGVFLYRLQFAVRFAEFHQWRIRGDLQDAAFHLVAMFREDVAPKAWWAVMLSCAVELLQTDESMLFTSADACMLMQKLQEISTHTAQGAGEDYLPVLAQTTKSGGEKHALQLLQVVRLVLARYYARCGVIGVGGKNVQATPCADLNDVLERYTTGVLPSRRPDDGLTKTHDDADL